MGRRILHTGNSPSVSGVAIFAITLISATAQAQDCVDWFFRLNGTPGNRWGHGMVFDTDRGVTTLFGGSTFLGRSDETWNWNGTQWLQQFPENSPTGRFSHGLAYDTSRHVMVMFGGVDINNSYNGETWEWDGVNWTQRFPANSPFPRAFIGMTFDAVRKKTVLFGGQFALTQFNDTWEWDGTNWSLRTPPLSPSARYSPGFSYDSNRGVAVLYGGYQSATSTYLGDTWEWDGNNWSLRRPAGPPIANRAGSSMAFDPNSNTTLMFGGILSGARLNDAWLWDGNNWVFLSTVHHPIPRSYHGLAFDPLRGMFVLYGGNGNTTTYLGETWTFLNYQPTVILQGPTNQIACPGETISFHVAASGAPSFEYQWRKDSVALIDSPRIKGAQTSTLTVTGIIDPGPYDVIIYNTCGSTTSGQAYVEFCKNNAQGN